MAEVQFFDPKVGKEVRQRKAFAKSLMQQSEQPTSSEMVSGHVVKQSPLLGFAKMLGSGLAGYEANAAEEQATADESNKAKKMAEAIRMYGQDPQAAANMLMESPATSEYGMQMGMDAVKRQRELQDYEKKQADALDLYGKQRS